MRAPAGPTSARAPIPTAARRLLPLPLALALPLLALALALPLPLPLPLLAVALALALPLPLPLPPLALALPALALAPLPAAPLPVRRARPGRSDSSPPAAPCSSPAPRRSCTTRSSFSSSRLPTWRSAPSRGALAPGCHPEASAQSVPRRPRLSSPRQ
jgi:hypothetical protein